MGGAPRISAPWLKPLPLQHRAGHTLHTALYSLHASAAQYIFAAGRERCIDTLHHRSARICRHHIVLNTMMSFRGFRQMRTCMIAACHSSLAVGMEEVLSADGRRSAAANASAAAGFPCACSGSMSA